MIDADRPDPADLEAARAAIRQGTDRLHSQAAFTKPKTYTDAESAARARARLEGRTKP